MKEKVKSQAQIIKEVEKAHQEIQPALYQNALLNSASSKETEVEWNTKILKLTLEISNKYPELSKYIEEMKVTIPDKVHPEISVANLKSYYDSLDMMLKKYVEDLQIKQ